MEQDTYRTALAAVQKICAEKGEADAADIAKAVGLSSAAAEAFVRQIDEDSFADVIEIDLCWAALPRGRIYCKRADGTGQGISGQNIKIPELFKNYLYPIHNSFTYRRYTFIMKNRN